MTWGAWIDAEGVERVAGCNVCENCKHAGCCQVHKVVAPIQSLLTSVDTGCTGHMASGEASLLCHGFEAKEIVDAGDGGGDSATRAAEPDGEADNADSGDDPA